MIKHIIFDINNQYDRKFVAYFHYLGPSHLSLGFHMHLTSPNVEIHVPFGYFRIGWKGTYKHPDPRIKSYGV